MSTLKDLIEELSVNTDEVIQSLVAEINQLRGFQATHQQNIANAQQVITQAQDAVTQAQAAVNAAQANADAVNTAQQAVISSETAVTQEDQAAIDGLNNLISQLGGQPV